MNNKSINKYIFSFLLCSILASNSVSTRAEEINIEKINFELGVSCLKQNDYKQAIKYFELVVQKNPKNIEAYYNLGTLYSQRQNYIFAANYFTKAVEINPNHEEAKKSLFDIIKILNA